MRYTLPLHYTEESPATIGDDVIAEGMRRATHTVDGIWTANG